MADLGSWPRKGVFFWPEPSTFNIETIDIGYLSGNNTFRGVRRDFESLNMGGMTILDL